ncbi:hypothetical protein FACS189432_01210 [Bacteroidia bacterium]|nr:hypothetical protein FACS189426_03470 [Bacteroidia bacterium]GHT26554.1 hypothetical protein FACS189432_01210 [Bacteroidia bacterium]GHT84976.1 hypothetical protein FACS18947_3150 [Bacteroidia bacterium]GHV71074.1 hypothetical protein FACS189420_4770 [Bacteroidia bacterium]
MGWNKKMILIVLCIISLFPACSVISFGPTGGSVNYDMTKTIRISEFPNRTAFYPQMTQMFDLALRKRFIEQTRLKEVTNGGDIEIEGEITSFQVQGMAVKEDAYSSQTRLTVSVRVQYVNNKETGKDVDQSFSAFKEFDSARSLDDVQDELMKLIIDELVDLIYNATVANW